MSSMEGPSSPSCLCEETDICGNRGARCYTGHPKFGDSGEAMRKILIGIGLLIEVMIGGFSLLGVLPALFASMRAGQQHGWDTLRYENLGGVLILPIVGFFLLR